MSRVSGIGIACALLVAASPVMVRAVEPAAAAPMTTPCGSPATASDAFVAWARPRAIPLRPPDEGENLTDLVPVGGMVGSARVVALGEPAHGAYEPLAFRNRLIRYLVTEQGFTAIALESGLTESQRVNDFVSGGPGEAEAVARDGLTWGFGAYAENVDLLRWMRQYNADPAHSRKIRFYGIDLSGGDEASLPRARVALDEALAFLSRAAPERAEAARLRIGSHLGKFAPGQYATLSSGQRSAIGGAIAGLVAELERDRDALVVASSREDYEWALRNAIVAREIDRMMQIWPGEFPTEKVSPDFYEVMNVRDAAMAANVGWALEREGPAGRVLVFAHDAHVMDAEIRGTPWIGLREGPKSMGQSLRRMLGDELFVIGVNSAANGPGLPATPAAAGTLDDALNRVAPGPFLIDLRPVGKAPDARDWADSCQSLLVNFAVELHAPPRPAFDAVVFFEQLTPANGAPRPPGG